ncbi:MAG: hypothetical protein R6X02_31720 [Enhygromyxa sp.]
MLYASIQIDLPDEELLRRKTPLDWLAGLIGREPQLETGESLSTVTGLSVFERVVEALTDIGITDVLSVTVDRKVVYVDVDPNSGDLPRAVGELDARGVLERPFEAMQMVLSHRAEGLHTLVEVDLQRRVTGAVPELTLAFAGRVDETLVRQGETPELFAQRLRALAHNPADIASARDRFTELVAASARALKQRLGELALEVATTPTSLRLIRPGPRALDHFRRLTWGPAVRMPSYRPVPVRERHGAYDDLFYHHYFDPYFDFVAWVTITELVAGCRWPGLDFEVVDESGRRLFGAADAPGQAAVGGDYGGTPVRIEGEQLVVDSAVPEFGGPDPGEIIDPRLFEGIAEGYRRDEGALGPGNGGAGDGDGEASCGASCGSCGAG